MRIRSLLTLVLTALFMLTLVSCGGAARDPLDGTSWVLISFGATSPLPGTSLTLSFQGGQTGGSAGCNSYGGSYQVAGDKIEIGPIAITEMACLEPQGVMEQETAFVQFLQAGQRFQIQDGELSIFGPDGAALVFEPQD